MKKIYALFVAIDEYTNPAYRLHGCKNDAIAMREYVEAFAASNGVDCIAKSLFDTEATRKNVVEHLQNHFKDAQDGDTALFYYSGHGSQKVAPPQFWYETDRMLGTLVCQDSRAPGSRDLVDKELSYLLYQISAGKSNLHLVAITDCCHSAGNTRGDIDDAASASLVRERRVEPDFRAATFTDFIGSAQYEKSADGKYYYPPITAHVALSAARADQTAKEFPINGKSRGAFTSTLIETLQAAGGRVAYSELIQKINAQVKNRAKEQSPQLDTYVQAEALAAMPFLNVGVALRNGDFVVAFEKASQTWLLRAGLIQGIAPTGCTIKIGDHAQSVTGKTAKTTQVGINTSTLDLALDALDQTQSYAANLVEMQQTALHIAFAATANAATQTALKKYYTENIATATYPEWTLVADPSQADYLVQAKNNQIWLSRREDAIPVFERMNTSDPDNIGFFAQNIATIARWTAKHGLQNPFTTLTTKDVTIDVFLVDNGTAAVTPVPFEPNGAPLVLRQPIIDGVVKPAKFQLRIRNLSPHPLWTSALYFDSRFGITNSLLRKQFLPASNGEAWLTVEKNGQIQQTINASVAEAYLSWGVNEMHDFVKILVSTDELDTNIHNQAGLKLDMRGNDRDLGGDDEEATKPIPMSDWCAFDVPITIVRPTVAAPLKNANAVTVGNVRVSAGAGFQGSIALTSSTDALRTMAAADAMATRNIGNEDAATASTTTTAQRQKMFDALPAQAFGTGKSGIPPLDALELLGVDDASTVNVQHPLVVQMAQSPKANESVVAFSFDDASGLMIPVGVADQNGTLNITQLPDATPTLRGQSSASLMSERSLGGSIQLFFRKIVNNWTGDGDEGLQQLRLAIFDDPNSEVFRYESDRAIIEQTVAGAKNIALFVHGIIGDTSAMPQSLVRVHDAAGKNLLSKYDAVLTFDYENLSTPIEKTAEALKKHLAKIGLDGSDVVAKMDIIAHSMGGLVSRWFIENPTLGGNKIVRTLVQCGTPNAGSEWSDVEKMLTHFLTLAINGSSFLQPWVKPLSFALKILGVGSLDTTLKAMNPEKSEFLVALNKQPADPAVPYHVIVGNTQLIRTQNEEHWNFLQKVLNNLRTRGIYTGLDMVLFKDQPNDICVRVNSITAIPHDNWRNTPTTVEVPSDHLSYFDQADSLRELGKVLWAV